MTLTRILCIVCSWVVLLVGTAAFFGVPWVAYSATVGCDREVDCPLILRLRAALAYIVKKVASSGLVGERDVQRIGAT